MFSIKLRYRSQFVRVSYLQHLLNTCYLIGNHINLYTDNNSIHYRESEKICNSKTELDSIKAYWPREDSVPAKHIFENYTKPCNSFEQLILNSDVSYFSVPDVLKIKIKLHYDKYQEVLNTKAFCVADLWASIGGYVGVFCGFSILQTTTHYIDTIKKLLVHFRK